MTYNHRHSEEDYHDLYIDQLLELDPFARNFIDAVISSVFHSDNQESTGRLYYFAPEMCKLLRKAVNPNDFVSTKEIIELLNKIYEKERIDYYGFQKSTTKKS